MKNNNEKNNNEKNNKNNNKNNKKVDLKKLSMIAVVAFVLIIIAFKFKVPGKADAGASDTISAVKDKDIIIQTKDIINQPSFYPAEINGTKLEVIAVKASDGTIRTSFNTCQVCYNSGKGYYEVEGNELVCQNCGNRFGFDDVEVVKGGCNPVPITKEYKTVNDDTINISKDYLTQATVIFSNWK